MPFFKRGGKSNATYWNFYTKAGFFQKKIPSNKYMHLQHLFKYLTCTGVFLLLLIGACSKGKERIVSQTVEQRVSDFRKKEIAKCRTELLEAAEKTVDSLLLHEALHEVQDSLKRLRPFKPIAPPTIPPIDSLLIKPVFEQ